jgi:hypothetical protein
MQLRLLLHEALAVAERLADELEEEIRGRYGMRRGQVALNARDKLRYTRDMRGPAEARKRITLIREAAGPPGKGEDE